MLKFTVRRENELILDHVHGTLNGPAEIILQNKFSGRDFSMVIQPGDIISWTSDGEQQEQAIVQQVRPIIATDVPTLGTGSRIIIERTGNVSDLY